MVVMDCRRRCAADRMTLQFRGSRHPEWSQWSGAHSIICCVRPNTRRRAPSTPAATSGVDLCGKRGMNVL
eukprot:3507170-Prymnesium_polylepis.1